MQHEWQRPAGSPHVRAGNEECYEYVCRYCGETRWATPSETATVLSTANCPGPGGRVSKED